jgi:hypothetical protein
MLVIYITRSCLSPMFSQPKRSRARLCQQVSTQLTHACMACVLSTPPGSKASINRNSAVLFLLCKQASAPNPHHTHQLNTSIDHTFIHTQVHHQFITDPQLNPLNHSVIQQIKLKHQQHQNHSHHGHIEKPRN